MTAFSTFTYAKKYFVSNENEFITEPNPLTGKLYKIPQDLINLLADNITVSNVGLFFPSNWCFPHSGQKVLSGKKRVAVTWYYVNEQTP